MISRLIVILIAALLFTPGTARAGGSVGGVVTFQGPVPSAKRRPITTDTEVCGHEAVSEDFLVGKKGVLKNAVVFLEGNTGGGRLPAAHEKGSAVDQKKCRFDPHVVVVPAGVPLTVKNSDAVLHNVRTVSRTNPPQSRTQPATAPEITLRFERPEFVNVTCDIHPWMDLWVVVAGHPHYAVTGGDGRYRLEDVPAGDYNLAVWHEVLGTKVKRITVREGEHRTEIIRMTGKYSR